MHSLEFAESWREPQPHSGLGTGQSGGAGWGSLGRGVHRWVGASVPWQLLPEGASEEGTNSTSVHLGSEAWGYTGSKPSLFCQGFPWSVSQQVLGTEQLLTRLLEIFHGQFVAQQEGRRRRAVGRAAGALQGFLGTVYTDVILVLCHLGGHPDTHLVEPLVTAPVTLHPVHLQESTAAPQPVRGTTPSSSLCEGNTSCPTCLGYQGQKNLWGTK